MNAKAFGSAMLLVSSVAGCPELRSAPTGWAEMTKPHGHSAEVPPGAWSVGETPDAPFRGKRPAAGPPPPYAVPAVEKLALGNGIDVLLIEQHELPIVRVDLVVRGGFGDLPDQPVVVLKAMGALLEKGTASHSALEIASGYDALGAEHGVGVELESVRASVKVLASKLEAALDLLQDVVLCPSFPQQEIDLLKGQWLDAIPEQVLDPETLSWNATELALYAPPHPYGHAYIPTPEEVSAIDRGALQRAHARAFALSRASIVVVGDTTRETVLAKLERTFGKWHRAPGAALRTPPPPPRAARTAPRVALVDRPGLAQSLVYLAEPAISWSSSDREDFALMNIILGGFWMSRLNANLRERLGDSYWVNSMSTSWRRGAGPFRAGGAMQVEKTAEAVTELLREVRTMTEEEPEDDELEGAKHLRLRSIQARFETTSSAAEAVDFLLEYGLPLDEYARLRERVQAVTRADIRHVARKYLHPDAMKILIVADRAKVEPELAKLRLGPIEIRDAYGRVTSGWFPHAIQGN
jgi:predicted Zn-dependent peptidase